MEEFKYKHRLLKGANQNLFEFAKQMRKVPTNAEKILWEKLRNNGVGYKFRRQQPIANFIPDFYCHKKRLAIETDGAVHNDADVKQKDAVRTEVLKEFGITVLRIPNSMVENSIDKVISIIKIELSKLEDQ